MSDCILLMWILVLFCRFPKFAITSGQTTAQSAVQTADQTTAQSMGQTTGPRPQVTQQPRVIPDEQKLLEALLKSYHMYSRPVFNASHKVVVKFGLTLVQISDMDEVNQVLTINVWLEQEWVDERLTWNPKDYNGLKILRIPCEKLWLPDIVLYNSADDFTTGYMKSKAMVHYDGNVFWPPPARFRSSCKIDITYFPFDDQVCELKFGSWTYDGFQVDVTNRSASVDLQNYVFSGEWELIDVRVRRTEVFYACCEEPYPDVRFTIIIRRKTLYYLFNIIFPCLWLTILSLLGFWLPPDSGEKITLGITVLLAFSVFMLLIAESMPATSEFVPLIGIYLTVTMAMTSLSIILTVFVLQLHHVGPHQKRVPRWLWTVVIDILAPIFCLCHVSQRYRHYNSNNRYNEHSRSKVNEIRLNTFDSETVVSPHMSASGVGVITCRDVRSSDCNGIIRKGWVGSNSNLVQDTEQFVTTNREENLVQDTEQFVTTNREKNLVQDTEQFVTTNREENLVQDTEQFLIEARDDSPLRTLEGKRSLTADASKRPTSTLEMNFLLEESENLHTRNEFIREDGLALEVRMRTGILTTTTNLALPLMPPQSRNNEQQRATNLDHVISQVQCITLPRRDPYMRPGEYLRDPNKMRNLATSGLGSGSNVEGRSYPIAQKGFLGDECVNSASVGPKRQEHSLGNECVNSGTVVLRQERDCVRNRGLNSNPNLLNSLSQRYTITTEENDRKCQHDQQRSLHHVVDHNSDTYLGDMQCESDEPWNNLQRPESDSQINQCMRGPTLLACSSRPEACSTGTHSVDTGSRSAGTKPRLVENRDSQNECMKRHLQVLVSQDDEVDIHQEVVTEWRLVAHVIDRLLFWLFLVVAFVSSIIILIIKPMTKPETWKTD